MNFYVSNIDEDTLANNYFRKVIVTSPNSQLVLMCLKPGEDIGLEVHNHVDQFFRIEQGRGVAVLDGEEYPFETDFAFVVPAGTEHNVINASDSEELKLYTIYSPANHPDGTVHKTKEEADIAEQEKHHK